MDHQHQPSITPQRLSGVKTVIAVASGKGGVGKSTVAVNLAAAFSQLGYKVGILDADIYGPSQHIMMGMKNATPQLGSDQKIIPLENHGLKVISFGFFVKPEEAVVWRGPLIARMIQQFIDDVKWGELDILVVDLPPGTGDAQLSLTQLLSVAGVVIVTTPQDVALADAIKGVNMFQKVNVDILGIVENMSSFVCPHCEHETPIFSKGGGETEAKKLEVPFLGAIPLEADTRKGGDEGIPIVMGHPSSPQAKRFIEIAQKVDQEIKEIQKKGRIKPHPGSTPNAPSPTSQGFSV